MKINVAVLRGGPSSEYALSLKTGAEYLRSLPEDQYTVRDIFIDMEGVWHSRGIPTTPVQALAQSDVVLNALHGGMGEDGTVSRFLEQQGIAYAGSRAPAAALAHNKIRAREALRAADIMTPQGMPFALSDDIDTGTMAMQVFETFAPPYVVKPVSEGHSTGVRYVATIRDLPDAIGDVLDAYGAALVEEYINGEQVHASVLENFRNQDVYVFPIAQQNIPKQSRVLLPSHYSENSIEHVVPTKFTHDNKSEMENIARQVHAVLGMQHMSQVDMIKSPRGVYVLEADSVPALHSASATPKMLESVGVSVSDYAQHLIKLAMNV
ncbi:MAG: D-alanyl-alanine synthetase D-alanine-D-alanine ligase [Candidatus Kaiserbacteria bacterium]|nr:D-alanyl-alanine synthetase D-alanine-D-alanine ligase [Candidatus Kaiserbacteria bacterium]